ncbi:restriction endonuclease subunit S [Chryseobacterium carnipullorum]|uniref:Restriction endonuclease subunit S n=1 Tax=Chryseobacterium carnipullorum TaxID=1124835 RepID=A0A376DPY6_CHRCU|nr:restriction endonuclease subunit S [Chryseobacterium carnipullorum]AZA48903.1 restriction endonuclease subunit S [Chryseobacterium carnipullorum]AZA63804.1 restriction endonuclease subunit S [Chryseobacterium carnipullorum]STC93485.1 Type I restriction enzyme EcoKI specificity protein [Chryseobacterium carnipullorum]
MVKENTMKQTEIGLLPVDWHLKKLGSVAFITKLAGFEYSKYFNSYKDGGEIIVVRGTNITNNKLDLSDTKYIPRKTSDFLHRSKLSKGDLVFAYVGTIGPIYLIKENNRFHLGPNTAKIKIEDKDVNTDYIFNYFLSEFIRKEIDDRISVGAQPSLSMAKIRDFSIPLPPLPEQEAIAEALSDADAWIESLEQLIAKKRLIKQGAMQELLSPKEDWEVKKLGEVCSILNNLRIPIKESSRIKGDTPYYGANGIQGYIEGFTHNGDYVLVAEDGANDLNNYPINYVSGKIWVNNHAHVLQGILSILSTKFLSYLLKSIDFQNVLVGGTRAKLNKSILEKIEFSFPSLTEQTRIATILSDMDAELEALEAQLGKARKVKQGMMQELLTGRVRFV